MQPLSSRQFQLPSRASHRELSYSFYSFHPSCRLFPHAFRYKQSIVAFLIRLNKETQGLVAITLRSKGSKMGGEEWEGNPKSD